MAWSARLLARLTGAAKVKDTYPYLREKFIRNGEGKRVDSRARAELVERFERIDREVPIGTTPTDGLFLAEMLLNLDADGDVIECGCFAGGSSAKLSLVAARLGRKLHVFDSFEGLPAVEQRFLRDRHLRRSDAWVTDWTPGRYAARQEEVQANIERHGEPSVVRLVKGWFSETLVSANLPARIAFAFADVDLVTSARDCFTALWPALSERGVYATHDASYVKVLQGLYDPALWRDRFRAVPPILFGAGFGLCNESPHLGYMVKGEALDDGYLKSLTIDK